MRFLPLTSLDGAFFEKFPLFSNFLRKLLPDPGRPSGGRCTAACNKGLPPRGKAPALRGRSPSGGRLPGGGGFPPGAKTISFSAEKETVLDSKEKMGSGLRGVATGKTAACVFTHRGEDQPRPLRPSHGGTGMVFGSILRPPGASTLRAGVVRCLTCGGGGRACVRLAGGVAPHKGRRAPRRKRTTAALCRESGTRRRRVVRTPACLCSTRAGRNGRKGSSMSYESRWPPWMTTPSP